MGTTERILTDYRGLGVSLLYQWKTHSYEWQLLPLQKSLNALHGLYEWKSRKITLRSRPFLLRLNTSAICNLRCLPCLQKQSFNLKPGQSREPYLMSMETFDNVISQTGPYAQRMTFDITGEPMMNARLFDMVEKAHERKVFTYFCTNYNLMTPALLPRLFESGLDKLRICLDGYSQDAYEKYRIGGDVEKLKQAIAMTMEEKRRRGAANPLVEVHVIRFFHVQPELPKIMQFCREQGVDRILLVPDGCNFDGSHVAVLQGKPYTACFWPWLTMVVDSDGSVYTCGESFDGRRPMGNVNTDPIDSIWNNDLYRQLRRFLSGKSSTPGDASLICGNCPEGFGRKGPVVMSKGIPRIYRNRERLD